MSDTAWIAELWEQVRPAAAAKFEALAVALDGDDPQAAILLAHSLAGSLGSYGHADASAAAAELERLVIAVGLPLDDATAAPLLDRVRPAVH